MTIRLRHVLGVSCIQFFVCGLMCMVQLYYILAPRASPASGVAQRVLPERL